MIRTIAAIAFICIGIACALEILWDEVQVVCGLLGLIQQSLI